MNRPGYFSRRPVSGLLILTFLGLSGSSLLLQWVSDDPQVVLEMGGTYEYLQEYSSASFTPLIRGHAWMGVPHTDARLRFVDSQYGFLTPLARFFTVGFEDNVVKSIRMSPQIEPLLLDDALKVVLDLQDQWRDGGWLVAGPKSFPSIADTPEWRSRLRDVNKGGTTYWQAGEKYQVMLFMNRFKYSKHPNEERYLITLNLGRPWVPFDDDEYVPDQTSGAMRLFPKKTTGAPPCQPPPS